MKIVQDLKFRPRWVLGVGLVLLMLAAVAAAAAIEIGRAGENVKHSGAETAPALKLLGSLRRSLQDVRRAQASYLMAGSEAGMDQAERAVVAAQERQESALRLCELLLSDDEGWRRWRQAGAAFDDNARIWERLRRLARDAGTDPAATVAVRKLYFGEARQAFTTAAERLDVMWEHEAQLAERKRRESLAVHARALRALFGLATLACLLCLGVAWAIVRSLVRQAGGKPDEPSGQEPVPVDELAPAAGRPARVVHLHAPARGDSAGQAEAARGAPTKPPLSAAPAPAGWNAL